MLVTTPYSVIATTSTLKIRPRSTMGLLNDGLQRSARAGGLLLIAAALWLVGTLLYRLFFSPLSRLPGPWLSKISTIPETNALKQQRRARWVTELFGQHPGAVAVRTGPASVSFNSPEAVKAIYGILRALKMITYLD